jgi:ubiquinone/menaquinone biosynthesis C-methylase UbiE
VSIEAHHLKGYRIGGNESHSLDWQETGRYAERRHSHREQRTGCKVELTDILICPSTGSRLRFNDGDSVVRVHGTDVTYPIVDGIVDFCPEVRDTISKSYDAFASRYDAYITSGTSSGMFTRLCNHVVWGFSDDRGFVDTVLSRLPSEFDGVLLDVPVGTGVFTSALYTQFPDAAIIAVDYSMGMLQEARKRFLDHGVRNVHLFRADVSDLPVRDGVVDMLLSMNGLHVFPDKLRAVAEMRRVVREQGVLIACGYASGARRLTDWFVNRFVVRRGFFSSPFFRIDDMASQLEGFTVGLQGNIKSFLWFEAVKK